MKLLAATDHTGLDRRRRRDAVARVGWRRRRRLPDDTHTDIVISPQGRTLGPDGRIPFVKVGEGNLQKETSGTISKNIAYHRTWRRNSSISKSITISSF